MARKEKLRQLSQNTKLFVWRELLENFEVTKEMCYKLLPLNPPSVTKMNDFKDNMIQCGDVTEFISNLSKKDFNDVIEIIVQKSAGIKESLPLIYTVTSTGDEEEISKTELWELRLLPVIVEDPELYEDRDRLTGLLAMYWMYPKRIERQMQREGVAKLINILRQRFDKV